MDVAKDKNTTASFPFDSLRRFQTLPSPHVEEKSDVSARFFDNRGRVSGVAASLRSKLGRFQTRLSASSFLSEAFSWQVKTAMTSDPEVLLAKASDVSEKETYTIGIDRVASARSAVSSRFVSDNTTLLEEGAYQFNVTAGAVQYAVDFVIERENGVMPTNRTVLMDLERAINRLGLDITATLQDENRQDYYPYREDAYKKVSFVSIVADKTGETFSFSLSDTEGSLIETLGLDRVQMPGLPNRYRINGNETGADSNTVEVVSGRVSAYLLNTTGSGENVRISVEQGAQVLASELTGIIGEYNSLIQWIDDHRRIISPSLKTALLTDLDSIAVKSRAVRKNTGNDADKGNAGFESVVRGDGGLHIDNALEKIGLALNKEGTLDIRESFAESVSGDLKSVWDALAGPDGFFTIISRAIRGVHGENEGGYLFSRNSVLLYHADGTTSQSIYRSGSTDIINFFS